MRAGILAIGNEVLDGLVLDTNSNWMENRLAALSVEIVRIVGVRDDEREICRGLEFLQKACDVIMTSGGLGPTHDDITLKSVASCYRVPLLEDQAAIAIVERQYKMLSEKGIVKSPKLTEPRKKMALIPKGAIPLDNQVGGAPGVMFEIAGKTIFCLPGVPAELKFIFMDSVEPWLERNVTQNYFEKIIEFEWKDESRFSPFIDKVMMTHPGVYIKSMPSKYGATHILRIWISARGKDRNQMETLVENAITSLAKEVGQSPKPVHPKDKSR